MKSFKISYPNLTLKIYISLKEGFGVQKKPKDKVALWITLVYKLTCPETFTLGDVSVFDKYLH
jgi:hypothetical protein